MPLVVTNPVDQAGYVTPKRALEVSAGAIVPMGAVASGMTIATSAVRGTATGNAVAATIEAGVTIANLGSDGAAPAPATVDVTTGMHRGAVTQAGSTVAVMTSGSAMTFGSAMTSVTAMATAAGMSETSGNVGIAISTRTSVAVSVRGVSVPPGGITDCEAGQQREPEGQGLAGPGATATEHVATSDGVGDGGALDREGICDALLGEGRHERDGHPQLGEP